MAKDVVTVSDAAFQRALIELSFHTRKEFSDVVKRQGRLLAVQLARFTQPYQGSSSADGNYTGDTDKIMGEKAVRRDLYRLFAPPFVAFAQIRDTDREVAKAFWRAIEDAEWLEAERLVRQAGGRWRNVPVGRFDRNIHKTARNRRGNVSRHVPAQIVTNPKAFSQYAEKKVKLVGLAKGGWAAAAKQVGGMRGLPRWVTRHARSDIGNATDNSRDSNNPHVILRNTVPYIGQVCSQDTVALALRVQKQKMLAHINRVINDGIDRNKLR